ncbi:MAG: hypothetical protein O7D30_03195 [Rickettsia endosymbiont of Ixodes persulcatus]|nr:hypothetical protein [Rickettsia endosymbiont of Ixodes persulcatus]MCZ6909726.1 hypothetical protein [Rickettsia endosymbiont of Ixodes persulcatus]MCZ6924482.1 hypothetical protein [Rickettsia endosymbiont of Ixodes persulcatus]
MLIIQIIKILFQAQMDKYNKIVKNLLKFGANPSLEANNILNFISSRFFINSRKYF